MRSRLLVGTLAAGLGLFPADSSSSILRRATAAAPCLRATAGDGPDVPLHHAATEFRRALRHSL